MEEKNDKEDGVKVEDKEGEVRSLPLPDPMPFDVDTRLPADLNPPEKLSSLDFLVSLTFCYCSSFSILLDYYKSHLLLGIFVVETRKF